MADKTTTELLAILRAVVAAWDRNYGPNTPEARNDHNGSIAEARRVISLLEYDLLVESAQIDLNPREHNFGTVEGRRAALAELGPEEYARAHERYRESQVVTVVNGYRIRQVNSRFGTFFCVDRAHNWPSVTKDTQAEAEDLARSLPAGPHSSGEV